jgi:hypothetical protein
VTSPSNDARLSAGERILDHWRLVVFVVATTAFTVSAVREFTAPGGPTPGSDAAFFQHAGWYMTQGAIPYVDFWDVKPPVTHFTSAGLALISFGDMYVLHVLAVLLTASAGVAVVALVAMLTHRLTDDRVASVAAAFTVLCLAGFHYNAVQGFRPKFVAIALGLGAVLLQLRGRPGYSGVLAALSAGYIQHGAVFAVLALGLAVQTGNRRTLRSTFLAMVATTVVVVTPIIALGGGEAMITETIVALTVASEPKGLLPILRRLGKGLVLTGYAGIPILLGAVGVARAGYADPSRTGWVVVGTVLYGIQIFFFDFDSYADLFFGLVFVALGVGLLVASLDRPARRTVVAVVVAIMTLSVGWLGGLGVVTNETVYTDSLQDSLETSDTLVHSAVKYVERQFGARSMRRTASASGAGFPDDRPSVVELFWSKGIPESCHYRLSATEIKWIEQTGGSYDARTCGGLP